MATRDEVVIVLALDTGSAKIANIVMMTGAYVSQWRVAPAVNAGSSVGIRSNVLI